MTRPASPRVVAIVQARMSSRRLPGKVLKNVRGKPLLRYLIERLEHCRELQGIMIATSTDRRDDVLESYAQRERMDIYRGSIDNVAERMLGAAREASCDGFVRISGDSPLMDQALVDRAVRVFREKRPDLVTNVQTRTFPKGQSVEVIDVTAMQRACAEMSTERQREHVTPCFYENADSFDIAAITSTKDYGSVQLSVDTAEDLERFERILDILGKPYWSHGFEKAVAAASAANGRT